MRCHLKARARKAAWRPLPRWSVGPGADRIGAAHFLAVHRGAQGQILPGRKAVVACKFLRQTFHELARTSLPFCVWAQCYYQMQLQRGKGRQAAFRALAFKWQRIMWRCWHDHVPYDDRQYLDSLKRDNNELYTRVVAFQAAPAGA